MLDACSARLASWARAGAGARVVSRGPRPARTLELYEFEGCPFCRKVREALSALDLEVLVYPCPKFGKRFRPIVAARGGREQFPYLVDPNTGAARYESDVIVRDLFARYGAAAPPQRYRGGALNMLGVALVSGLRLWAGSVVRPSRAPGNPLELWGFEAAPTCRRVRELLCSLEIPYRLCNVAPGSERSAPSGVVPHLSDPNTGAQLAGAGAILGYLRATYQLTFAGSPL